MLTMKSIDKVKEIISKNPGFYHYINKDKLSEDDKLTIMQMMIDKNWQNLMFITDATLEVMTQAVKSSPFALQFVTKDMLNDISTDEIYQLYMIAINANSNALQYIYKDLVSPNQLQELYKVAIQKNGYAIEHVHSQTEELCMLAVKTFVNVIKSIKNPSLDVQWYVLKKSIKCFDYIDKPHPDVVPFVLEQYPKFIQIVMEKFDTNLVDWCKITFEKNGESIKYLFMNESHTAKFSDEDIKELCLLAVESYGPALQFIKTDGFSGNFKKKLYWKAIHQNSRSIEWIPEPSIEMKEHVIQAGPGNICYINKPEFRLWIMVVMKDPYIIRYAQDNALSSQELKILYYITIIQEPETIKFVRTYHGDLEWSDGDVFDIYMAALKRDPVMVYHVHPPLVTPEELCKLYLMAVRQNGMVLKHIQEQSYMVQVEAVKQNGRAVNHVQFDLLNEQQTFDICLHAVKQNGMVIGDVYRQKISDSRMEELCLAAVQQNGLALKYIHFRTKNVIAEAIKQNTKAFYVLNHPSKLAQKVYRQHVLIEFNEFKELKELKELNEFNKLKELKELKELNELNDLNELKDLNEFKELKVVKELKELKELKDVFQ